MQRSILYMQLNCKDSPQKDTIMLTTQFSAKLIYFIKFASHYYIFLK